MSGYPPHIVFSHMATLSVPSFHLTFQPGQASIGFDLLKWGGSRLSIIKGISVPLLGKCLPTYCLRGRQNRLSTHQGSSGGRDEVQMHPGRSSVWYHGTETVFRSLCQIKYHGAIPFIFLPQPKIVGSSFKFFFRWYAYLNIPAETASRLNSARMRHIWSPASCKWNPESYFHNTLHIFMTILSKTCYTL